MEKEKKIKVKKKIDWKHEMALAPGYIIVILWVAFTFMLLGWIIAASLSTTTDIFAGKALKFPSGLHFENYVQAWGSGGVATFFTNSLLYAVVSCVLLILICAPAAYVLARYTFIGKNYPDKFSVCDGYSNHDDRSSIVWSCSKSWNSE